MRSTIRFVSVVLPCLNEEQGVGLTVQDALAGLRAAGVAGEVIVVDNGSTDASRDVAMAAGARVLSEPRRGYGSAHRAGLEAATGDVVVMADADRTYDLVGMPRILRPLLEGADIVVASRLQSVEVGAMPFLHRYVGTPILTRLIRVATGSPVPDSQSGYRAFWREPVLELGLRASGMEYASELALRAARAGLVVREVPAPYRARVGESKLNTLGDGWRHLRMLLILSPHLVLIYPGALSALVGLALSILAIAAPTGVSVGFARFLPVFGGPLLLVLGAQALLLGALAARGSDLAPPRIRRVVAFLAGPNSVNLLLRNYALVVLAGVLADAVLALLWAFGHSAAPLLGVAGLAQAAILIGLSGLGTVLGAELARESVWD